MLSKIRLHGVLASKYQEEISLQVDSIKDAIRGLNSNFEGFSIFIRRYEFNLIADGKKLTKSDLHCDHFPFKELHILPITEGEKGSQSAIKYVIGGLEIVAGAIMDIYSYGTLGAIGNSLILAGVSTIAGTVINSLTSMTPPKYDQSADAATSNIFDGARNTSKEGVAVPILYGEMTIGSLVASGFIAVDGQKL